MRDRTDAAARLEALTGRIAALIADRDAAIETAVAGRTAAEAALTEAERRAARLAAELAASRAEREREARLRDEAATALDAAIAELKAATGV
jgi:hypothetical protein